MREKKRERKRPHAQMNAEKASSLTDMFICICRATPAELDAHPYLVDRHICRASQASDKVKNHRFRAWAQASQALSSPTGALPASCSPITQAKGAEMKTDSMRSAASSFRHDYNAEHCPINVAFLRLSCAGSTRAPLSRKITSSSTGKWH